MHIAGPEITAGDRLRECPWRPPDEPGRARGTGDRADGYVSPSLVAQIHAGCGQAEAAIEWLYRASDVRAVDLAWLAVRPVFDTLRAHPRFNALVARMKQ